MSIFKQVKLAIFDFDKYEELLKTKISKTIFYALFFIIIFNMVFSSMPFITYYAKTKGFNNFIENYVPDFTVKNNKIIFKEYKKIETPLGITFIYDNKENNYISTEDKKDVNNTILKFTPTEIISSALNINIQLAPILQTFNITQKSDLINIKFLINISNTLGFFVILFSLITSDIFGLLIIAFVLKILCKMYNLKLPFSNILKLTIYINTMPYILNFVFSVFYFPMPVFIYIGIIITYFNLILKNMTPNKNKAKNT